MANRLFEAALGVLRHCAGLDSSDHGLYRRHQRVVPGSQTQGAWVVVLKGMRKVLFLIAGKPGMTGTELLCPLTVANHCIFKVPKSSAPGTLPAPGGHRAHCFERERLTHPPQQARNLGARTAEETQISQRRDFKHLHLPWHASNKSSNHQRVLPSPGLSPELP